MRKPLLSGRTVLDNAGRDALFAGSLFIFDKVPEVADLIATIAEDITRTMAPHAPLSASQTTDAEDLAARCRALCDDAPASRIWNSMLDAALTALGCDPATTCHDRLRLRIQTSDDTRDRASFMTLAPHRDTWGSNVQAQVNWWAPVFPVDAGRTIALWPDLFDQAVPNTSAEWDYEALIASRRRGESGYPLLPLALEPHALGEPVPVVIEPGAFMAFAGAHMHASVPNRTDLMRYSIEVRTVDIHDLETGRGAPNVDAAAPRRPLHWFHRLSDGKPLSL